MMLIVKSDIHQKHNPYWKFILGSNSYEVKDVKERITVIEKHLKKHKCFEFIEAENFSETSISETHHYFDFIKKASLNVKDSNDEVFPDLFPGENANLVKKLDPLWAGLYCTDCVTPLVKDTYNAAKASADIAMTGAKVLLDNKANEVYSLCRPPGHHAGPRVFGGYCYFNNVVLAAKMLVKKGPVAILDIDYHHGNGTQEFLKDEKNIFTCSIHADPSFDYPYFWGYEPDVFQTNQVTSNLNIPLPSGTENEMYLKALDKALEAIKKFKPSYLIIAAGFDTHMNDSIGQFNLTTEVYNTIGKKISKLNLLTLICQEGGYNIEVLGASVESFLLGFISER